MDLYKVIRYFFVVVICAVIWSFGNTVLSDESSMQKIIDEMERLTSEGTAPNYDDMMPVLKQHEHELSETEFLQIAISLANMQRPIIPPKALSSLFKSKIKAIRSVYLEYDVNTNHFGEKTSPSNDFKKIIFIRDRNKFYSDVTFDNRKELAPSDLIRKTQAYNGDVVSAVAYFSNKSRGIEGGITPFETLQNILPMEDPLYYSCLLDLESQKLADRTQLSVSSILDGEIGQSGIIFEKTVTIGDTNCIVVQYGLDKYYFDPQKDFSIVKIEKSRLMTNEKNESMVKPYRTFMMTNHIDCGNGIWIPQNITLIFNFGSRFDRKVTINISKVKINDTIKEEVFTNIFPDNTIVSDLVHHATYKWGERPSINGLLQETVKPRSTSIYNKISIIVGLIMIVIEVVLEIRKRILKRRAS
ncbi:MAG: hypothetical protein LBJ67_04800 [Planctomycetaceae bacterium]|jgi:hypothetical protein|nr:hypothetical protein [Planctomycetaceae bacterium]